MKCKWNKITVIILSILLVSCTYNPFSLNNELTGNPVGPLAGGIAGVGILSFFNAPRALVALGGLGGAGLGYYFTTLRYASGGIINSGGQVFTLGGLIQTIRAFDSVQEALSFLVTSFTTIAEWRAVLRRLITFLNHMYEVEESALHENHFNFHKQKENAIIVRNVCITTPRHEKLLENINETFVHGQHYLLKGTSGIGKSTFVRAIAQIWPFGSGEITLPENKNIMYLPQKPYMPIGTLEQALLFPDQVHTLSRKELIKYLEMVHLGEFADRLDFASMWSQQFSPGEQQRIGFVRVLIHKPDWVFLDESTSSLDKEHEKYLYDLLKTELPQCSYISVGHRSSLVEHHEHVIDMTKYSAEHVVV